MCSPGPTGLPLALIPASPAPPPGSRAAARGWGRGGGAGGRGTDDWAGARGLLSPSAGSPRRRCRPGTGRGEGCPGCRGSQPGGAGRRPGAGAEERREAQGPPPRPLCPCAPPPEPVVAGGGRWPVAEAAPGPLGTALSIDSNLPLPTPTEKKKESVDRGGGRAVECGLRPHIRFTYAEKERGSKGRASIRPGAPSRLQGERTAPTRFREAS